MHLPQYLMLKFQKIEKNITCIYHNLFKQKIRFQ